MLTTTSVEVDESSCVHQQLITNICYAIVSDHKHHLSQQQMQTHLTNADTPTS